MFLLDVRYNPENSTITRWIKDGTNCKPVREVFYPKIYISCKPELLSLVASLPGVKHTHFEHKCTWPGKVPEKVISASVESNSVYEIASMLEAKGCSLYNIDLDPVRQYLLQRGMFPMARLRGDVLDDSQYALDYEIPGLVSLELLVTPGRDKGIITMDDPIGMITLGNTVIENKDEAEMINELNREVARADPDLIMTERGDSFDLPYLYHRAALHDIDLAAREGKGCPARRQREIVFQLWQDPLQTQGISALRTAAS